MNQVGQVEIDWERSKELEVIWKKGGGLDLATDGGLKDGMGTVGYAIFEEGGIKPFVKGLSGELEKDFSGLTSTREEVRALVAVMYLLKEFEKEWA